MMMMAQSSSETIMTLDSPAPRRVNEIEEDLDRVRDALALAERVLGVGDRRRNFDVTKLGASDRDQYFRSVRHPRLFDSNRLGGTPGEETQPVVRVADVEFGLEALQEHGGAQHRAA